MCGAAARRALSQRCRPAPPPLPPALSAPALAFSGASLGRSRHQSRDFNYHPWEPVHPLLTRISGSESRTTEISITNIS